MTTQQKRMLLGALGLSLAGLSIYSLATTQKGDWRRVRVAFLYGMSAVVAGVYYKKA